jgi:putative phosphoribosyl transferase
MATTTLSERPVRIAVPSGQIDGSLTLPESPQGVVLFAHGSGSSRYSPRNRSVARSLNDVGLATLLIDLLTPSEERTDIVTAGHRFNVDLLAERLSHATDWLASVSATRDLPVGYFGASTGAAAALVAAANRPDIPAIVSRGGRPDLAGDALARVSAATLLVVGGLDSQVIELNQFAYDQLGSARDKRLEIVPGATHLFEEPGTLAEVARLARQWFLEHLPAAHEHRD